MASGIYQIYCLVTNKRYIGSSVNLYKRKWQHTKELKTNIHDNRFLQRAWNKYGALNFKIETLIECSTNDLLFYEDLIIKGFKSNQRAFGYNLREVVNTNLGMSFGKYHSGDKYNRVTLLERDMTSINRVKWLCQCDCGTIWSIEPYAAKKGTTKSCGCLNKELASALMLKLHRDSDWHEKLRETSKQTMIKTMSRPELRQMAREHINRINEERTNN